MCLRVLITNPQIHRTRASHNTAYDGKLYCNNILIGLFYWLKKRNSIYLLVFTRGEKKQMVLNNSKVFTTTPSLSAIKRTDSCQAKPRFFVEAIVPWTHVCKCGKTTKTQHFFFHFGSIFVTKVCNRDIESWCPKRIKKKNHNMQISFPKHIESKQSTENKKKLQKKGNI